jgi:uncharacterized protein with HEPN domain
MKEKNRDLFRLYHILEAIEKILKLVEYSKDFDSFQEKWVDQDAMIRNFEIIGEASNHISSETKDKFNQIEWYKIRGMRNFMTHEYFGIKLEVIWLTANQNIPLLKSQIEEIIKKIELD